MNNELENTLAQKEAQGDIQAVFKFIWSGSICEVTNALIRRNEHQKSGIASISGREWLTCELACKQCNYQFVLYDKYYNRRGPIANKKSRYYCLDCAIALGFIELMSQEEKSV